MVGTPYHFLAKWVPPVGPEVFIDSFGGGNSIFPFSLLSFPLALLLFFTLLFSSTWLTLCREVSYCRAMPAFSAGHRSWSISLILLSLFFSFFDTLFSSIYSEFNLIQVTVFHESFLGAIRSDEVYSSPLYANIAI